MTDGNLVLMIICAVLSVLTQKPIIHKYQSCGYRAACFSFGYFEKRYLPYFIVSLLTAGIYPFGLLFENPVIYTAILASLFVTTLAVFIYLNIRKKEKSPFAFTPRAMRLYSTAVLLTVTLLYHSVSGVGRFDTFWCISFCFLMPALQPISSALALMLTTPFELINNRRYILRARKKLAGNPCLIKIGITGSFGKTTVKSILKAMLDTKYNVVATEGNFNTPLGIARSTAYLDSFTDVFIAEMGARRVGDISSLVKMVAPQYGLLTGVTTQHLDTFKNVDNVYSEKMKLLEGLPEKGIGFVQRQGVSRELNLPKNVSFVGGENDKVYVKDVKVSQEGSVFKLCLGGKEYDVRTKLLGAHNINNVALAAALADELGVPHEKIVKAVEYLPQTPHRLQLIKNGGVTIIDDSYNANPVGAAEALNVLKEFKGRKIVITPGMVELGDREEAENMLFGCKIAAVADIVILIGRRADDIRRGLREGNFSDESVLEYKTLEDAERDFPRLFSAGDNVMFINDLPEKYY